jgi:protein-S-isoprenylcysteine O-methyltransferase
LCSVVAYAVAAWKFYEDRIPFEEATLRQHFGQEYVEYAKSVPSGVPFIK